MTARIARLAPPPLLAVGAAVAVTLLGDQMLYAVMPSRPGAWGLSIGLVGVLLSVNRLVRLVSNPLAAVVVHRFGARIPFALAMVGAVIVTATYGWATAFWVLLLARIGWGLCWSLLRLGGQWEVLEVATDRDRGLRMGTYAAITRSGALAGAVAGGLLTDAVGHRATLTMFAAITAAAGLGWYLRTRRSLAAHHRPIERLPGGGFRDVLRDRQLLIVSSSGLVVGLVSAGLLAASLGFYLREEYGAEIPVAGLAIGVASFTGLTLGGWSFANVALSPIFGHLSDRSGRVRGVVAGMLLQAAGVALLGVAASIWLVLLGVALAFIGAAAAIVQLTAAAGDLASPARRAAVLATFATFLDLGAAAGPLLGLSFASLTALRVMFVGAGVVLLPMALTYRRVMRSAPPPADAPPPSEA